MSAMTPTAERPSLPARPEAVKVSGLRKFRWAMSAEWIKLRSVRSTRWSLLAFAVISFGLAVLVAFGMKSNWSHMSPQDIADFDPVGTALIGMWLGQLVIGVFGALAITAEYSTGTIRSTLSAVPSRSRVVVAKAVVFSALAAVISGVTAVASLLVFNLIIESKHPGASLFNSPVAWRLVGATGYLLLVGILSMGLGLVIRSTAGTITAVVSLLFVAPIVVNMLPKRWGHPIDKWLPDNLANSMLAMSERNISPGLATAVMAGYALACLLIGTILLSRRDA